MLGALWTRSPGRSLMRLALTFILLALLFAAAACGDEEAGTSSSTTVAAQPTTTMATTTTTMEVTTTTTVPTTTTTVPTTTTTEPPPATTAPTVRLSSESLAYAESLGGKSYKGEELYFVIGASVETEAEALTLLEGAKAVGDMQSYFIVQNSSNFEGMNPGWWVVFEAYREYPSVDNLAFCRRPFPDAYVKSATVRTSDPIPVYDDLTSG